MVSKTFTTAETMLNARTLKKWLLDGVKVPFCVPPYRDIIDTGVNVWVVVLSSGCLVV